MSFCWLCHAAAKCCTIMRMTTDALIFKTDYRTSSSMVRCFIFCRVCLPNFLLVLTCAEHQIRTMKICRCGIFFPSWEKNEIFRTSTTVSSQAYQIYVLKIQIRQCTGISTLWHFRLPLPIQMFTKVASSFRLSGIGMPSPIL